MADFLSPTAILIHLASLLALIGMLMRDQLRLRALVLAGAGFEIAYYWLYPAVPLWPSIVWSALVSMVNVWVMVAIWHDRRESRLTPEEREIFVHLAGLTPGQFRRLHAMGRRHEGAEPATLTREGEVPDRLWFVHRGEIAIRKGERELHVVPPCFIGEISLLLGGGATATVTLPEGGVWFAWSRKGLRKLFRREPAIRAAFDQILNRDMA
ncbi:MAG TPA: cyclic nucleotide-binding domain-containing protein, partial [Paracoccaceae bacterium]|nr:cyclic nucleotide-binding domain-containing protein [Paracoccaceae bacterium]